MTIIQSAFILVRDIAVVLSPKGVDGQDTFVWSVRIAHAAVGAAIGTVVSLLWSI